MLHSIRQPRLATAAVVVGLLGAFATAPAWSAAQRTFVASFGLTTNTAFNCSLAKPCRAFNEAISVTSPGGEVVILDTAGYGPMTITQSIKIIGPSGVYGGISVLGAGSGITTGIVINAGSYDVITLRGLDIAGVPGAPPLPTSASTSRTPVPSTSRSRRSATSRRTPARASTSRRRRSRASTSTTASCANAGPASSPTARRYRVRRTGLL